MHRVDTPSASPNENGVGLSGFTEGDPLTLTPPTKPGKAWFNDIQENVARAITGALAGITLVKGNFTQLYDAIVAIATNILALRLSSDEFIFPVATYPNGKTRTVRVPFSAGLPATGLPPFAVTDQVMSVNSGLYHVNVGVDLPTGGYLKRVRVRVQPGTTRGTLANRTKAWLQFFTATGAGSAATNEDDGTTALQTLDTGDLGTSFPIDRATYTFVVTLRAGNTAGTNNDVVRYIELEYTALGPRRD